MIAVPSRMISIMIDSGCFLGVRQDKGRAPCLGVVIHAFWRGDDLVDLSEVNMEPKRIKVRDGRNRINIKIL
ncbi:hypothetical protein RLEG12_02900 (plasmid) [Rhizobium leguminosarum bv. trifolii CB782]|uniref:Uncharacterized protein n=1 Tax=Rhizobium hidalgonense TaxID=1538159 RepID=A0ABX4JN02_9HYPH|nr:hypothetical protein RLEG12_02900 [Rhizobium leguminosarum bv. trifolii CB782]PDT20834.1 hypothetical protein CO674_25645 [Rhizobium hidalgonense]PON07067.1 hypothetical protein ATY29_13310 [Rhizobium hidalgonense]RWX06270.1 hypothetical protein EHI42_31720 [Rhizobium hidalgonense]